MRAISVATGLFGAAALSAALAGAAQADEPKPFPAPISEAVEVGGVLYLSGQLGRDPVTGKPAPGGFEGETRQMMANIGSALARHGLTYDDVFKCTVYLTDMKTWPAFNDIYRTYFKPGRYPVRSAVGVNGLALGYAVEAECWARARPAG